MKKYSVVPLLVCLCVPIFFLHSVVKAQDSVSYDKTLHYWINVGAGPASGTRRSDMAIGSLIEIAVTREKSVFFAGIREFGEGSTEVFPSKNLRDAMQCFELRYGRSNRKRQNIILSVSAGLSYVSGKFKGDIIGTEGGWFSRVLIYEKIRGSGVGLPLSVQFMRIVSKGFAVGLEAYANINKVCTFYGFNLNVNLGKLRSDKK